MHEVVAAVGIMGKLHSGLGNPTRMSQRSMLAALNRLPKQLWDLYAAYLLWSYRNSGLGDSQLAGLPRLGKGRLLPQVGVLQEDLQLACPWLGEKTACHTVNTGREHGSLSIKRWHAHCAYYARFQQFCFFFFCGFCLFLLSYSTLQLARYRGRMPSLRP